MINNADEVRKFLSKHGSPKIVTITTIKDGFVTCIGPVPTICGPELHVSANTRQDLNNLMRQINP